MREFVFVAPCHFGLEAILKREIQKLGYDVTQVEDGRVTFKGEASAFARANMQLRTAERVLLKIGDFMAYSFEDLFSGIKSLPWEEYIPEDGKVWVTKAASVNSKLFSTVDIQSVSKKAIVERFREVRGVSVLPETGASFPLRIFIHKDRVLVTVDTSGTGLHKRGYRKMNAKAPISETLAAALLMLTPWKPDRPLVDPFCGSGTFVIEAALMAANIAPGMHRHFLCESWGHLANRRIWFDAMNEAEEAVTLDVETNIQGFDIDELVIRAARENAESAGVSELIHFQQRPVSELRHPKKYGFIVTNPPYGARIEDLESIVPIYEDFARQFKLLDTWSAGIITSWEGLEQCMGRKADRNRKLYNGMIKTYFYQFMGPKPPRQERKEEN